MRWMVFQMIVLNLVNYFRVTDIGREIFTDNNVDGQNLELYIEVSYEYSKDDDGWIFIQSVDDATAEFYKNLDDQLVTINNNTATNL